MQTFIIVLVILTAIHSLATKSRVRKEAEMTDKRIKNKANSLAEERASRIRNQRVIYPRIDDLEKEAEKSKELLTQTATLVALMGIDKLVEMGKVEAKGKAKKSVCKKK